MATKIKKGIIVTNITQTEDKFRRQIDDFLFASKRLTDFRLIEVYSTKTMSFLDEHEDTDFVIMWDKDYYLAKEIERRHIPVYDNADALLTCDDKALTYFALRKANVQTPKTFVFPQTYGANILDHFEKVKENIDLLKYPLVIKERFGSFGDQVYLVHNEEELKELLKLVGTKPLLAQEYISEEPGVDYRLYIVNNTVIAEFKRQNPNDFRSNVNQGGTMTVFTPTMELSNLAIRAARATGAFYAGVDVVYNGPLGYYVLEVNSNARTIQANKVGNVDITYEYLKAIKEDNSLDRSIRFIDKHLF
jgi:ribosomal protein S6--L-glutamate ligase/gamma-F420-2:alpha-L-glutamate ligase